MKTALLMTIFFVAATPGLQIHLLATVGPSSAGGDRNAHHRTVERLAGLSDAVGEESGLSESGDKKKDPGYELYKGGYKYILQEEWQKARKQFDDLIARFKGHSEYVDDAAYWSAYALEHMEKDKDKAFKAFKDFVVKYPESNYFDDAVAEMHRLKGGRDVLTVSSVDGPQAATGATTITAAPGTAWFKKSDGKGGYSYGFGVAPSAKVAEQKMRLVERQLMRQLNRPYVLRVPRAPGEVLTLMPGLESENELDPATRIKMDALQAIGETKEDSISFRTLRDVALDPKQPRMLRETALEALSNFSHSDVLPVFLEVAKRDTSEVIQNMAIDYMGQISKNKNRSLETLAELFAVIPKKRVTQLQTVLSSIAEIGNDKAVDFLARVAKTDQNYDLRSDAIYYLGNIGGDKAREALYEILRGN